MSSKIKEKKRKKLIFMRPKMCACVQYEKINVYIYIYIYFVFWSYSWCPCLSSHLCRQSTSVSNANNRRIGKDRFLMKTFPLIPSHSRFSLIRLRSFFLPSQSSRLLNQLFFYYYYKILILYSLIFYVNMNVNDNVHECDY